MVICCSLVEVGKRSTGMTLSLSFSLSPFLQLFLPVFFLSLSLPSTLFPFPSLPCPALPLEVGHLNPDRGSGGAL